MAECPRYLDVTVSSDDADSVWRLIQELKPQWRREDLQKKQFTSGAINTMTCYYQKADVDIFDGLVVRVYGSGLVSPEGREREFLIAQVAHASGCFPKIYGSFNNGFVYQYASGKNPNLHDVTKPEFIQKFARKLYTFHSCDVKKLHLKNRQGLSTIYDLIPVTLEERSVSNLIPDDPDPSVNPEGVAKFKLYRSEFSKEYLNKEFTYIKSILDEISLPVSVCHLDLHLNNMLLDPVTGEIKFVDYDVSGHHYSYYDLAYFFGILPILKILGFTGPDEPTLTDEHHTMFLREYLHAKYEAKGLGPDHISDEEFQLIELQHKILENLVTLQYIPICLWLAAVRNMVSLLDHIPALKEKYLADKKDLPVLRDSCKDLIKKLANERAEWLWCVEKKHFCIHTNAIMEWETFTNWLV